ncbi:5-oxoprolinase subunit PxpA [Halanaerocella petrolearia]
MKIDLNSDLGEDFGRYTLGNDEEIIKRITSANIACGFHAGDPLVMEETIEFALENKVGIGAHPGLPDLMGFGRRKMELTSKEVRAYLIYQVGALNGFIRSTGGKLQHVKPHGALYNMAADDYQLARAVAEAVYDIDSDIILVGLAGSELIKAGRELGLRTANEVFADRAYTSEGRLVSRNQPNAVIEDEELVVKRVLKMVTENKVTTIEGTEIDLEADTICVHGDNKAALNLVDKLESALEQAGIDIMPLGQEG